jgi:hypothetical protein
MITFDYILQNYYIYKYVQTGISNISMQPKQ